jgi:hypothetical protein
VTRANERRRCVLGKTARRLSTVKPNSLRIVHEVHLDSRRSRRLLRRPLVAACFYHDLREWSGTAWVQRTFAGGPGGRQGVRMAFDTVRGELVIAGGQGADSQVVPDHWRWNGAGGTMTATATTAYPVTPASLHTLTHDPLRGFAGATQRGGLRLLYWDVGRWHDAGASTSTPDEYLLALATTGDLRRALTGDVGALVLAVTPDGDNAQSVSMAQVQIDAVEVRVVFGP